MKLAVMAFIFLFVANSFSGLNEGRTATENPTRKDPLSNKGKGKKVIFYIGDSPIEIPDTKETSEPDLNRFKRTNTIINRLSSFNTETPNPPTTTSRKDSDPEHQKKVKENLNILKLQIPNLNQNNKTNENYRLDDTRGRNKGELSPCQIIKAATSYINQLKKNDQSKSTIRRVKTVPNFKSDEFSKPSKKSRLN